MQTTKADPSQCLTLQFLTWLEESPRSYADAMDAWRTSCPRLSIWEDALRDGLIERSVDRETNGLRQNIVAVTARGRLLLAKR